MLDLHDIIAFGVLRIQKMLRLQVGVSEGRRCLLYGLLGHIGKLSGRLVATSALHGILVVVDVKAPSRTLVVYRAHHAFSALGKHGLRQITRAVYLALRCRQRLLELDRVHR